MEIKFTTKTKDRIYSEYQDIDDLEPTDMAIIRVLLYETNAMQGLLKSEIIELLPDDDEVKYYKVGKRLSYMKSMNIIDGIPNLQDMRSELYRLSLLKKYGR